MATTLEIGFKYPAGTNIIMATPSTDKEIRG